MKCSCGNQLENGVKFCNNCGKSVEQLIAETEDVTIIDDESVNNEKEVKSKIIVNNTEASGKESVINNDKKSNKKILIPIGILVGIFLVGMMFFVLNKPEYKIVNAEYSEYPYFTITVVQGKDKYLVDTTDVEFYQDGVLIEDYNSNGHGDFDFVLNEALASGDVTNIEIKDNKNDKVLASGDYTISTTIFDNLFGNIELVSEEFPIIELRADINPKVTEFGVFESMVVAVNGVELEPTYILEGNSIIIDVNAEGTKRKLDTQIDINYKIKNIDKNVNTVIALEPFNNINIEFLKSDYSEYPIVRHYVNFYDDYNNNINDIIDTADLTFYDITSSGTSPIEILNATRLIDDGKASVELIADVSDSLGDSGLTESKNSLLTFLNIVQFDNGDEVELISFSDVYYENQRFTSNKVKLDRAVRELELGGMTALYDALMHGLERTVIQRGSKFIIATTDGMDNSSYISYREVIDKANEFNIPIYIIGVGNDIDSYILNEICTSTGGEFIQLNNFGALQNTLDRIYKHEKDGFVIEYNAETLQNEEDNILVRLDSNTYGGEIQLEYDPIFVSWGGNVRVDDPSTPYDERQFDSNYYDDTHTYEVVFEDVSWQEASNRAVSKGGYLARITSEEEFDVIVNEIESVTTSKAYLYFLGGSRKKSYDGNYTWVDSNLEVKSGTIPENAWLPGEPSLYEYDESGNVTIDEEYLNMFYVKKYDKWFLNDCTDDLLGNYDTYKGKVAYVIEYEK